MLKVLTPSLNIPTKKQHTQCKNDLVAHKITFPSKHAPSAMKILIQSKHLDQISNVIFQTC